MNLMNHPVFKRFWYATLSLEDLESGPKTFKLLGENIVLWLAGPGRPAAARDRCPHRSARLSLDSVVIDGNIRCGYHGWQFSATGVCKAIPQLGGEVPDVPRNRIRSYRCEARYGFAWVTLSDEPLLDIPFFRYSDDPAYRQVFEYAEDWNASMLRVCENALDISHVSFVHRGTFGNEDKPNAPRLDLMPLENGVSFACRFAVANHELQQKNLRIPEGETVRTVEIRWLAPSSFVLHFTYPNGLVHQIVGFATPIDNENVRRIQFAYRSDTEEDAAGESVAAFDRKVGAEDRRMLESCDPDYPLDVLSDSSMSLDRPSLLMRQYLQDLILEHDPNAGLLVQELEAARQAEAA